MQFSPEPLTLDEAAFLIKLTPHVSRPTKPKKPNTLSNEKIRRLYDIVNVFRSLGLVKKVKLPHKKSAYQWEGITTILSFMKSQK